MERRLNRMLDATFSRVLKSDSGISDFTVGPGRSRRRASFSHTKSRRALRGH